MQAAAALIVAYRHPPSAHPADGQPLQQGGAFPRRTPRFGAAPLGVAFELPAVVLVLVPRNVGRVRIRDQPVPLLDGQLFGDRRTLRSHRYPGAPIRIGPRIARAVQRLRGPPLGQWRPDQLALVRSAVYPLGELQPLLPEMLRRFEGRPQTAKGLEEQVDGLSDLLVRIVHDAVLLVIDQPHRQPHPQFSATSPGLWPALAARTAASCSPCSRSLASGSTVGCRDTHRASGAPPSLSRRC